MAALRKIQKQIRRMAGRAAALLQKPAQLMEFIERYDLDEVLKKLIDELIFLFRHYRPRRIRGYLAFGTGDPALTGQITGVLYLLLPARAEEFSIQPDFYDVKLEMEIVCSGHVRAVHALRMAIRLFRDKKIRRLIRRFMKKGE